jgi:hypothetical protein
VSALPPTAPDPVPSTRVARWRVGRGLFATALVVFLGLAAADVFGVAEGQVSDDAGGYELRVDYAEVSRPGLGTPFDLAVHHPGGFSEPIRVAISAAYLELFDLNGIHPEPSTQVAGPGEVVWEFDPPEGEVLEVHFDARLGPSEQSGGDATVSLLGQDGPLVSVDFHTRVMP